MHIYIYVIGFASGTAFFPTCMFRSIVSTYRNCIVSDLYVQKHRQRSTPWLKVLRSRPVWAAFVAHTCFNWGEYTFLTNIPTYLREVLLFDIKAVSTLFIVLIMG